MQLISKSNKNLHFYYVLLTFIGDMHGLFLQKIKKELQLLIMFLDEPKRKPNKIWVDKGSEFYNRSMKSWLKICCRNIFNT